MAYLTGSMDITTPCQPCGRFFTQIKPGARCPASLFMRSHLCMLDIFISHQNSAWGCSIITEAGAGRNQLSMAHLVWLLNTVMIATNIMIDTFAIDAKHCHRNVACFKGWQERKVFKSLWRLGRVKKISCLSSPTAPIFLPDRDFYLFFILRKTGICEGRHTIPRPFHRHVEESRRERKSTSFTEHCFQSARWPIACIWVEER